MIYNRLHFLFLLVLLFFFISCHSNHKMEPTSTSGVLPDKVPNKIPDKLPDSLTRITCRSQLLNNESEEPGYGLYSYILFAKRPNKHEKKAYLEIIEKFLDITPANTTYIQSLKKNCLNITYIPVHSKSNSIVAEEILRNYNYERAKIMLSFFKNNDLKKGPYIISSASPLGTTNKTIRANYFIFNFTRIEKQMIVLSFDMFLQQVEKEDFLDPHSTLKRFVVYLRNKLCQVGKGVDPVYSKLKFWKKIIAYK